MGRERFDQALGKFCADHRRAVVDYDALSTNLGGGRFRWVFDQWATADIPALWEEHEVKRAGSSHSVKGTLF